MKECKQCGSKFSHDVKYTGMKRYCHKCYLDKRRVYEKTRNDKRNAVLPKQQDVNWPHINGGIKNAM